MDKVTVTSQWDINDHCARYRLSNEWFIDREDSVHLRHYREWKYTIYAPGAGHEVRLCDGSTYRIAKAINGSRTLKGALAILNANVA